MSNEKLTIRQEKFCRYYVETGNATEAYRMAYTTENMLDKTVNEEACRLNANPKISARVEQLLDEVACRNELTLDKILLELEEARTTALNPAKLEKLQVAAAVAATMGKAKLLGMDKQTINMVSEDGSMSPAAPTVDFSKLTDKEIDQLESILAKASTD